VIADCQASTTQEVTVANMHKTNDSNTEAPQARAPMLQPELDMVSILEATPHRAPRAADQAPARPVLSGEGGLWWA
jgi:hypothetical protein